MVGLPEGYRRLVEEVANVYTWIESQQKGEPDRAGSCNTCGACCDFPVYGHRLYVTPPELIYLAFHSSTKSNPEISLKNTGPICLFPSHQLLPMPGGRCPYQQNDHCTIHEHRFAGCRIFTCRGDPAFQAELTEAALRQLKRLCEAFRIAYRYQDLPTALNAFAARGLLP